MTRLTALLVLCLGFTFSSPAHAMGGTPKDYIPTVSFDHGIASGDPTQDAVIIWTRVTPLEEGPSIPVTWTVATDEDLRDVVRSGTFAAGPERDYTVKVDVTGLASGSTYFYRFNVSDQMSETGQTLTFPEGAVAEAKFAVVSCSNYPLGYFNVYRAIADRGDLHAVLHLGDYYYEYAADHGWGREIAEKLGRTVEGGETVTLDDYRARHALYRSDPDLQAMTARHPMIAVWDDHESTNDSWETGAQNHQPETEGDWEERKIASAVAYHEWLPVRQQDQDNPIKIWRSFEIGNLASLIMLDTRLWARDVSFDYRDQDYVPQVSMPFDFSDPENPVAITDPAQMEEIDPTNVRQIAVPFDVSGDQPAPVLDYNVIKGLNPFRLPPNLTFIPDVERFRAEVLADPDRELLGKDQLDWLSAQMEASKQAGKPWQVIGQQVLMGEVLVADLAPHMQVREPFWPAGRIQQVAFGYQNNLPWNVDQWDGYPKARERVAKSMLEHASNAVVLAGDTHNGWAFNLDLEPGSKPYAVEFGAPGVSSSGMESFLPMDPAVAREEIMKRNNEVVYLNNTDRGYTLVTLTPEEAKASWHYVNTVVEDEFTVFCDGAFKTVADGTPGVPPLEPVACE
ncbi:MAG: alkaline phosphatase D family protein [Alphaproteobacteria bacterium]|nr:alkaline phosphatase D family protein [Alphaproteobacteria bacterium]